MQGMSCVREGSSLLLHVGEPSGTALPEVHGECLKK